MWLSVITSFALSGIGVGVFAVITNLHIFIQFHREIKIMFFNSLIGVFGIVLYSLNVPIVGWEFISIQEAVKKYIMCNENIHYYICTEYVDEYIVLLTNLIWLSNSRFIVWYMEYLNTLIFILFYLRKPLISIIIQYFLHTITFILSICCVVVVVLPSFPNLIIPYSSIISPIILQCVYLLIVLYEYKTIYYSKLYSINYVIISHDL